MKKSKEKYFPEYYKVTLELEKKNPSDNKSESYQIKEKSIDGDFDTNFFDPLTSGKPKIYIVKHKNEIIYVGFTKDNFRSRINKGLAPRINPKTAKHEGGYGGYKWRILDEVEAFVWVFNIEVTKKIDEHKWMFENIEAEIVFQLKQQGKLPKFQSEIHFYSEIENQVPLKAMDAIGEVEVDIAKSILNEIENSK